MTSHDSNRDSKDHSSSVEGASPVSIAEIRRVLSQQPARLPSGGSSPASGIRHAAVAMVFAGDAEAPDLCLIRRADRAGDPWSGHMAFPGGKQEPGDASMRSSAERETLEEVGLKLEESHFLAGLPHTPVRSGGNDTGMRLFPFVYYMGERAVPLAPNGEVAEAFWIPFSYILDKKNCAEMPLRRNGELLKFPSVTYGAHHIWGMTYRVLAQFAGMLSRHLPDPPQYA